MFFDLKLALRHLAQSPGFTAIAILTLTLGIGLNTSMFSLVNALLLRPLPFPQSGELVRLQRTTPQNAQGAFAPADFFDLKRQQASFGRFTAFASATVALAEPNQPAEPLNLLRVTSDFFEVLQIKALLGRTFRADEEIEGNHRVVILSYNLWQTRFGGAPDILGRTIRVEGEPHEIVGILPAWATDRRPFNDIAIFRPLGLSPVDRVSRDNFSLGIIGRRNPTLSAGAGETFIASMGTRIAADFPAANRASSWRAEGLLASTTNAASRGLIFLLLGLSGCVLMIACSNLANFLLARTLARNREFAVRSALGASRRQLFKPLAFEVFLLALAGAGGALMVAIWTSDWLSARSAASGGTPLQLSLDWRVLGVALGVSLLTALGFGLAPALFTARVDVNDALKSGSRGATATRSHQRLRQLLIIGQFAMAMMLLAGAGFFLHGAAAKLKEQPGWNSGGVVQGSLVLPAHAYPTVAARAAFDRQLIDRLREVPGVESVSLSFGLPFFTLPSARAYLIEGRESPKGHEPMARTNGISTDYFNVTGTHLLRGRAFTDADNETSPPVAVVSASLARELFPNGDAIGHRLARTDNEVPIWREIVGIAADVRALDLSAPLSNFQLYLPLPQEPRNNVMLAARTTIPVAPVLDAIRLAVTELDPDLPLRELTPVSRVYDRTLADFTMINQLLGGFAGLGLFLAALGIYGSIARTVEQRTAEIGLRLALGAQVSDVIRMLLGAGLRLVAVGTAIGLIGSYAISRLLVSGMPGLKADGGLVLLTAGAALTVVALLACYLPARRVSKIDPMIALRAE